MNWLNPLTHLAAEALFNSLWSGILLSGAVICLLRIFRRTSAKTRFAIWWLTLLAVIGLPLLFGFSTRGGNDDTNPTVSYNLATSEKSFHVTKIATDGDDALEAAQGKVKEIRSATETQVTPQSEHIPLTRSLGSIRLRFSIAFPSSYWLLFSFLGWFVVTAAMVCRVIRSCRHIRKLSRDASQLSQKYQDRLIHAKKIIGLKRTVRLCDSAQIS